MLKRVLLLVVILALAILGLWWYDSYISKTAVVEQSNQILENSGDSQSIVEENLMMSGSAEVATPDNTTSGDLKGLLESLVQE